MVTLLIGRSAGAPAGAVRSAESVRGDEARATVPAYSRAMTSRSDALRHPSVPPTNPTPLRSAGSILTVPAPGRATAAARTASGAARWSVTQTAGWLSDWIVGT